MIREIYMKRVIENVQRFFQPGGEKAIKIVESKRKELAALMKASLPPCDRMGLICRFSKSFSNEVMSVDLNR